MLLQYNLYTAFDDPTYHNTFRACTLGDSSTETNFLAEKGFIAPGAKEAAAGIGPSKHRRQAEAEHETVSNSNTTCGAGPPGKSSVSAKLSSWTVGASLSSDVASDIALATGKLAEHVQASPSCEKYLMFAYVRGTIVGLYSGSLIDKSTTPTALINQLMGEIKGASAVRAALEICGEGRTGSNTIGVVIDTSADYAAVQKIMKAWNEANCLGDDGAQARQGVSKSLGNTDVWSFDGLPVLSTRSVKGRFASDLNKRADCRSIRVVDKDTCTTLASKCGIGGTAFESFNKGTPNFCSSLQPGQAVCCSSGTLPDIRPKPQADGTCAIYDVLMGEGCQVVAAKHGLKEKEVDDINKETWGFDGCGKWQVGQRICVSSGKPPMPAPVEGAACGPQKPGSKLPTDGTKMIDMNPCPLDVCCNVWGNCGTTKDFCIVSKTNTGNPGTSKPGENGCQSNCGMEMVNNDKGPEQYRKIGYFEGWNGDRKCLHMSVLDVDKSFTHVHFAFGGITADHQVTIPDNEKKEWDAFVKATNYPKKILAFGGWAFSNEGWEARLLREVVSPGARNTFSDRVVKFAVDNKLNGLDFDWEYPGATDIGGSPPGQEDDGANYYEFLKLVRKKLPKDMSLSIATPASYWYLKGFPLKKMIAELDYMVYMTYDFHGQWDVGNKFTMSGCEAGNCLRSHINSTLTHDALVMATKAGVPSHKIVIGVSSYGRSFKMADAGCRGPLCTFLGARNQSPAKKGRCTDTGGYISNFEINEIIAKKGAIKQWWDRETDSDFLVYEQTEFVGYMTDTTKNRRIGEYKAANFGGTSDWAIDLSGKGSSDGSNPGDTAPPYTPDPNGDKPLAPCPYDVTTMEQIQNLDFANEIPPHCAPKYLLPVLHRMLEDAKARFLEIDKDGYDKYFGVYADYIVDTSGAALHQFMLDNGDTYFNCKIYTEMTCCTNCEFLGHTCKNCNDKCVIESPYDDGKGFYLKDMRCLPDTSGRGFNDRNWKYESTFWSWRGDSEKDKFYDTIAAEVGVPREKTKIVDHAYVYNVPTDAYLCMGSRPPPKPYTYDDMSETCKHQYWWHDAPHIGDFQPGDVYNPKTVVKETLDKIDINDALAEFGLAVNSDEYNPDGADEYDLVDALMLPIFMIQAGLEHMEEVVEMAKEIKEAEKIAFITNLLSAIFLVVGGAGGVIANAGMRVLGRVLVAIAETGNTGLGLYTAVNTPESVPLLIFGLVMSGVGIRDTFKINRAANLRRNMKAEELVALGKETQRLTSVASRVNKKPSKVIYC